MKGFFLVGGCVRDFILGLNPKDKDYVAVGYTAEEMISLGFEKVGADFPVFLHPESKDEYALPRTERSTGAGYHDFEVTTEGVSLEEDLLRRDLTINAMAMLENGDVFDPHGGMNDIKNKILRHTSEAFFEDPVRVLRLARFSARFHDFTIAEETIALIKSMKKSLYSLTKERIWKEVEKALSEKAPENFFKNLKRMEVLDILFPEIFDMIGIPQNPKYHAEGDVFSHTMCALREASKISKDPVTRFATLYHDIGKAPCYKKYGNLHTHDDLIMIERLLDDVKDRYKVPKKYISLAKAVAGLHHRVYKFQEMQNKSIVKTFDIHLFPKTEEDLEKFLDAINGDVFGRVLGEGDFLNEEDIDLIFSEGVTSLIKGKKLFLPGKRIRKDQVDRQFILKLFFELKKVSPKDFIEEYKSEKGKNPSVDEIKHFIYLEKIRTVAKIRNNSKK